MQYLYSLNEFDLWVCRWQGIASSDAFSEYINTCDWLRSCLLAGMKAKPPTKVKGFPLWKS